MSKSKVLAASAVLFGVLFSAGPARAEFITNGGFETGNFDGWTRSGGFLGTIDTGVASSGGPGIGHSHTGDYYAYLGPITLGFLSQTFTDSKPGESLTITMYLASNGHHHNEFEVIFDGKTLYEKTNISKQGYTELSFTVTSQATNTLQLGFEDFFGYLSLDDVSVTPAFSPDGAFGAPAPSSALLLATGGICVLGARFRRQLVRVAAA